jgi:hypothetical protein
MSYWESFGYIVSEFLYLSLIPALIENDYVIHKEEDKYMLSKVEAWFFKALFQA